MCLRSTVIFLTLLLLGGCDLFSGEEDGTIVITGTVVSAETGNPIEGLGISLDKGGPNFIRPLVATTRTDDDGTFRIVYDATGSRSTHLLTINDEPYDARFRVRGISFVRGEQRDLGVVELEENED